MFCYLLFFFFFQLVLRFHGVVHRDGLIRSLALHDSRTTSMWETSRVRVADKSGFCNCGMTGAVHIRSFGDDYVSTQIFLTPDEFFLLFFSRFNRASRRFEEDSFFDRGSDLSWIFRIFILFFSLSVLWVNKYKRQSARMINRASCRAPQYRLWGCSSLRFAGHSGQCSTHGDVSSRRAPPTQTRRSSRRAERALAARMRATLKNGAKTFGRRTCDSCNVHNAGALFFPNGIGAFSCSTSANGQTSLVSGERR